MRKLLASIVVPIAVFGLSAAANADSRIMEVFMCTLNEGHTMDEVREGNSNWLGYVTEAVPDSDVQSYITTPVVGTLSGFMYVDSYPNLTAWAAVKDALREEEGQAVEAALNELATCDSSNLYLREET